MSRFDKELHGVIEEAAREFLGIGIAAGVAIGLFLGAWLHQVIS